MAGCADVATHAVWDEEESAVVSHSCAAVM